MNVNRSKILGLLAIVAVAAVFGGMALTTYAVDNGEESNYGFPGWMNGQMMHGTCKRAWSREGQMWQGRHRFIEVSEEFEQNVIGIAEGDTDVQDLLAEGYNVTRVRPILKARVEGNGDVETAATEAVVMLEKDSTSKVCIRVDLVEAKVTKIVILTRTAIDKS